MAAYSIDASFSLVRSIVFVILCALRNKTYLSVSYTQQHSVVLSEFVFGTANIIELDLIYLILVSFVRLD